jgi:NitT/TauT family transport system substrate-binding protein
MGIKTVGLAMIRIGRAAYPVFTCVGWFGIAATCAALAATGGCAPPPRAAEDAAPIRLALNWFPDAQHAGFYAAEVFGLYDQQQLDVQILPGGPAAPVIQNVALRRVDFAVANADQILMARAQGAPVVAILACMQSSPRCIMVHRESGIRSLDQLSNVTLALGAGKAFAKFLQAELPLENVRVVPYTGSVALFLTDKRFAQQAYVFSEPLVARRKGADPVTLMVSDLGFNPYVSCLMTHEQLIRENPERVRRMAQCVREGWRAYFRNPQPVDQRIAAVNPQMDAASLEFGREALRPLVIPVGEDESVVGTMDAQRWQTLCDQLIQLELLPEKTEPASAYTTQFLASERAPFGNGHRGED